MSRVRYDVVMEWDPLEDAITVTVVGLQANGQPAP